jgi:hypothetical protein
VKYIILIATFSFFQACKKENRKTCYECDSGGFIINEVGCFTEKEWADTSIRTLDGREIDKSKCRKK